MAGCIGARKARGNAGKARHKSYEAGLVSSLVDDCIWCVRNASTVLARPLSQLTSSKDEFGIVQRLRGANCYSSKDREACQEPVETILFDVWHDPVKGGLDVSE